MQTDRYLDRQVGIQADGHSGGRTHSDRQAFTDSGRWTDIQMDGHIHAVRQILRQVGIQTDGQTFRWMDRHSGTY